MEEYKYKHSKLKIIGTIGLVIFPSIGININYLLNYMNITYDKSTLYIFPCFIALSGIAIFMGLFNEG